jgi:phosphoenolpyruvate synthase/pyruvate phosphate dikinase
VPGTLSGDVRLEVSGVIVPVGDAFHVTAAYGVRVGDAGIGTDSYWVDRTSLDTIKREIGRKARAYRFDATTGDVGVTAVAAALQDRAALDLDQLRTLGSMARRADAALGTPHVHEWTIDADGAARLVGARPIRETA